MIRKLLMAAVLGAPLLLGAAMAGTASAQEVDPAVRPDAVGPDAARHVVGLVTGEHGSVLEVRTRGGQVDVHWSDATKCAVNGEAADCERIAEGMAVAATGQYAGDSGQFHAAAIRARTRVSDVPRLYGVIVAEEGQTLAVETREGNVVRVHWTDDTLCRTRDARFDCERLEPRNRIVVVGTRTDDGILARMIGLVPGDQTDLARLQGIVTADHGRVLQVETRDGTVNVHWDAETVCQAADGRIDCERISERDRVLAVGTRGDDGNFHAVRILVRTPRPDTPTTDVRPLRDVAPAVTDAASTDVAP